MKLIIFIIILLLSQVIASDKLVFGATSAIEPDLMQKRLSPIMKYLEKATGKKIKFQTGYNYQDTINKFADGTFDIGYIGPAPYVKTKTINPDSITIIAGLKNAEDKPFQSVIVSKKGSSILKLDDIKNHRFAFGSPQSTLSYFVPMNILIDTKIIKKIQRYDFLGQHDKVAQYIIMGKYDAGAVKRSVAIKYSKYLQIVQISKPLPDFIIVANSSLDKEIVEKIQTALLNLKNPKILQSLKKSVIGFERREDSDYNDLRNIIRNVENHN